MLAGTIDLALPAESLFSVLGLSELEGLFIENARYPLRDFHLPFGSSRTISNVAEGPCAPFAWQRQGGRPCPPL